MSDRFLSSAIVAVVVLAAFTATGCGLPSIPTLEPPLNPRIGGIDSPGLQFVTFDHNPNNDFDDFKGYDLYYKLYPPPSASAASSITSDEAFIESVPKDTGPGRLQARGFLRLIPVTNRSGDATSVASLITADVAPSLPIDPTDSSITFSLDLRETENRPDGSVDATVSETDLVAQWGTGGGVTARGFRRRNTTVIGVSRPDNVYESFWDAGSYDTTDYDISRMLGSTLDFTDFNDSLVIVIYAITYGIDGTDFQPYYSEPLRLNEATIVVSNS